MWMRVEGMEDGSPPFRISDQSLVRPPCLGGLQRPERTRDPAGVGIQFSDSRGHREGKQ